MEFTYEELLNYVRPLAILKKKELPVLTSVKVAKLASTLREPTKVAEEVYNKLVDTYGEIDKVSRGKIVVGPSDPLGRPISENWDRFIQERDELLDQSVEIDVKKVLIPPKVDGKVIQIAPEVLETLEKIIGVEGA